jgi:RHS repeat-associated protein
MSVYQKRFEDTDDFPGGPLIFYSYKYDQLNRLTGQDAFNLGYNGTTNNWDSLHSMGDYLKERIAYDGNGNITRYLRNSISGATAGMDSLTYKYYAGTNRLRFIKDSVTSAWISKQDNLIEDLKSQPDSNYAYDEVGNLVKDNKDSITSIKWNVYGKITEINRIASATKPATKIQYTYDALGNRISQIVTTADDITYTWYVRDAQGNLLSTYTTHGTDTDLSNLGLNQTELYLYGSSRLGVYTLSEGVGGGPDGMDYFGGTSYGRGYKQYELSNHLGNVLTTISDRKIAVPSDTNSSLIDHYDPLILGAQDYYPFGMLSRVAVPNDDPLYRFGMNGKMMDNDVKGLGNQIDYGMRIYDPREGRFLSIDPLTKAFPHLTSYQFASNSPIANIDLDGGESKYFNVISDELYNAKGTLIFSTSHQIENKSMEISNSLFSRVSSFLTGNAKTGTSFALSSTITRIDKDGNLKHEQKNLGEIYIPGKDDKTRGGLYLVSPDGSYNNSSGDINGKDAEPISIDLLLSASGFPTNDGGEVEEMSKLSEVLKDPKKRENILKVVETVKTLLETKEAGDKTGETINFAREKMEEMKKENEEKEQKGKNIKAGVVYCRYCNGSYKVNKEDSTVSFEKAGPKEQAKDTINNH